MNGQAKVITGSACAAVRLNIVTCHADKAEGIMAIKESKGWDGTGLPPVGCECEFFDCAKWFKVTMMYGGSQLVVLFDHGNQIERTFSTSRIDGKFRPIRSEADKKRDAAISAIDATCLLVRYKSTTAAAIYDAIAAGEIPGVHVD